MDSLLTTVEAAARLGVSRRYVWRLIDEKRLVAQRTGRDWLIHPDAVDQFRAQRRRVGRPRRRHRDQPG
jgi:excisionase family DNA binding protein